jgi:hypothetical protein
LDFPPPNRPVKNDIDPRRGAGSTIAEVIALLAVDMSPALEVGRNSLELLALAIPIADEKNPLDTGRGEVATVGTGAGTDPDKDPTMSLEGGAAVESVPAATAAVAFVAEGDSAGTTSHEIPGTSIIT